MISYFRDTVDPRLHRAVWFWSDRGAGTGEPVRNAVSNGWHVRPRWRGAVSVYWRLPLLVWRPVAPCDLSGITAFDWTGRTRELYWRAGFLAVYLRTPCGFRWKMELGR